MQSHARPLLHESQLCELPTSPSTALSLLEAEVYCKTGCFYHAQSAPWACEVSFSILKDL